MPWGTAIPPQFFEEGSLEHDAGHSVIIALPSATVAVMLAQEVNSPPSAHSLLSSGPLSTGIKTCAVPSLRVLLVAQSTARCNTEFPRSTTASSLSRVLKAPTLMEVSKWRVKILPEAPPYTAL